MKITVERKVTSPLSPTEVFALLSDFTRTEEWDPGTISTEKLSGDGKVGTTYRNISSFMGNKTELIYTVEQYDEPNIYQVRGQNKTVEALDTMTFKANASGGTDMTYRAEFRFKGLAKLIAPFTIPAFWRLGNEAKRDLDEYLR